jgi:hypothetical protein
MNLNRANIANALEKLDGQTKAFICVKHGLVGSNALLSYGRTHDKLESWAIKVALGIAFLWTAYKVVPWLVYDVKAGLIGGVLSFLFLSFFGTMLFGIFTGSAAMIAVSLFISWRFPREKRAVAEVNAAVIKRKEATKEQESDAFYDRVQRLNVTKNRIAGDIDTLSQRTNAPDFQGLIPDDCITNSPKSLKEGIFDAAEVEAWTLKRDRTPKEQDAEKIATQHRGYLAMVASVVPASEFHATERFDALVKVISTRDMSKGANLSALELEAMKELADTPDPTMAATSKLNANGRFVEWDQELGRRISLALRV